MRPRSHRRSLHRTRTSRDSTQAALTKSFDSAEAVAEQHPQYADAIIAGAKQAFLDGDDWAYTAGVVAILLGAVLVFFAFPKHDEEEAFARRVPRAGHGRRAPGDLEPRVSGSAATCGRASG